MSVYDKGGFWCSQPRSSGVEQPEIVVAGDVARVRLLQEVVRAASVRTSARCIDAGCGTGRWTEWLAARLPTVEVTGYDKSLDMIARAHEGKRFAKTYVLQDITTAWPLGDHSVDLVVCMAVLMHCTGEQLDMFVRHAFRFLRPKGSCFLSLTHPALYQASLACGGLGWVRHEASGQTDQVLSSAIPCLEYYTDSKGEVFCSRVYVHQDRKAREVLRHVGFRRVRAWNVYLTKMQLRAVGCTDTATVGVPCFRQYQADK